jgi:diaminopropionate ammonia-lyase
VNGATRAVTNRHRRPERVPIPAGAVVQRFHERLPGYRPTPLRPITGQRPPTVLLKDESNRFGLPAFKILGATWAVAQTIATRPDAALLIAASAGNHGRAVAHAAAHRGVACTIFVPRTVSDARIAPISAEGAEVRQIDGTYDDAVASAAQAADAPGAALIADTGTTASASWVIDGYTTLFREAATQAHAPFDIILVPIGVGALAASAVRFATHHPRPAAVIGVEPDAAPCVTASLAAGHRVSVPTPGTSMTGLDCATPSAAAWPTLRDGLAGTITVTDAEAHRAMRDLAARDVVAGDCGAATLAGLWVLRDDDSCGPLRDAVGFDASAGVLCVSTEGATEPDAYQRIVRYGKAWR